MNRCIKAVGWLIVSALVVMTAAFAVAEEAALPLEKNYSSPDVVAGFDNLTTQGEWLGYTIHDDFDLNLSGDTSIHNQGIARSPRYGGTTRPIFYVPHSGTENGDTDYPGIMVVRMGTRTTTGERLRSNRLVKGKVTANSVPEARDEMILSIEDHISHHPSGIQMVGDILAVPTGGRIVFYNCQDPQNPEIVKDPDAVSPAEDCKPEGWDYFTLPITNPCSAACSTCDPTCSPCDTSCNGCSLSCSTCNPLCPADSTLRDDLDPSVRQECHGAQGVGITRLPGVVSGDETLVPSRILLVTNDDMGAHFHWSNAEPFFIMDATVSPPKAVKNPLFKFTSYRFIPSGDIKGQDGSGGYWPTRNNSTKAFQSISLVDELDDDGNYRLFLIGACNSNVWSPQPGSLGEDELYLYEVKFPDTPEGIELVGLRKEIVKNLVNPGRLDTVQKRYNGNLNAGGGAYVSPSGELIYYGVSHWNDGPEGTVKIAELRHKNVVRDGSYELNADAGGPYRVNEGSSVVLDGSESRSALAEPWIHLFADTSFKGQSVMVDYEDRDQDDYDDFSLLDEEPPMLGDDLCLDPDTLSELTKKMDDFKKEIEGLDVNDFFEDACVGLIYNSGCWITPPFVDKDSCKNACWEMVEPFLVDCRNGNESCPDILKDPIGNIVCYSCVYTWRAVRSGCYAGCDSADNIAGIPGPTIKVPWFDAEVWDLPEDTLDIITSMIETVESFQICGRALDLDPEALVPPMPSLDFLHIDSWEFDPENPNLFDVAESVITSRINGALTELENYVSTLIATWEDILLHLEGFNNMTSSVRWYAPSGMSISLFEKAGYGEGSLTFSGTGNVESIADLDSWSDRARSVRFNGDFVKPAMAAYAWSITAPPAASGFSIVDGSMEKPVFDAGNADGPMTVDISLTVTDSKGHTDDAATYVSVINVPPTVSVDTVTDPAGSLVAGLPPVVLEDLAYTVSGSFTDPGLYDNHTAVMAWGDGTLPNTSGDGILELIDPPGEASGAVTAVHTFAEKGIYPVTLTVDDGSDEGSASMDFRVEDAPGALKLCIEALQSILDEAGFDRRVERDIIKALSNLVGNNNGQAANGALDKLDQDNAGTALNMIAASVAYLTTALESGQALPEDIRSDLLWCCGILVNTARSLAVEALSSAQAVPVTKNVKKTIDKALFLMEQGEALQISGDYTGAINYFQQVVTVLRSLL